MRLAFIAAVLFLAVPYVRAGCTVGVVNTAKLLAEYPETKAAHAQLQKDADQREKTVATMATEIEKLLKEYEDNQKVWSETKLKDKAQVIRTKKAAYDKLRGQATSELEDLENKAGRVIYEKLRVVIAETAAESGVDLVLDADQALYAKDRVDLTDKIIEKFKKAKKKK